MQQTVQTDTTARKLKLLPTHKQKNYFVMPASFWLKNEFEVVMGVIFSR